MLGTLGESIASYTNTTTVSVLVATLLTYLIYRSVQHPHGFPPGPTPLPVVGNMLSKLNVSFISYDQFTIIIWGKTVWRDRKLKS